ncbi:MAG: hypothetical protein ABEN55_07270 [Bradymonadaceae bacterium]
MSPDDLRDDEDELVPWGPSSRFGKIALFVVVALFLGVNLLRGFATGWFVFQDGLPPKWTAPYVATVGYTIFTVVVITGGVGAVVYFLWRRLQGQREVDRIVAEAEAESKFEEASTKPYGDGLDEEMVRESEQPVAEFETSGSEESAEKQVEVAAEVEGDE